MLAPDTWQHRPLRLLIFRIGYFGDAIVTLPALWAIRDAYPHAHLTLLAVRDANGSRVLPHQVWPARLIDDYVYYPAADTSYTRRVRGIIRAAWQLRRQSFDGLVYLAPSLRPKESIARDIRLFRWLGVRTILGAEPDRARIPRIAVGPIAPMPRESDLLLDRLRRAGIPVPTSGRTDLALTLAEHAEAEDWLRRNHIPPEQYGHLVAIGPTAGMPSKLWPIDRYTTVARALTERHGVTPIFICGPGDSAVAKSIIDAIGAGASTHDGLSVRGLGALLSRCRIYVGNDTGAMHLAAAAGTRCIVVVAAIDQPGVWNPAGNAHHCLRISVPCEGCLKSICPYGNRCLTEISSEDVIAACEKVLAGE